MPVSHCHLFILMLVNLFLHLKFFFISLHLSTKKLPLKFCRSIVLNFLFNRLQKEEKGSQFDGIYVFLLVVNMNLTSYSWLTSLYCPPANRTERIVVPLFMQQNEWYLFYRYPLSYRRSLHLPNINSDSPF